jgi:hypothetical protein
MKTSQILPAALLALGGCAGSGPMSAENRLGLYVANSTPVDSFRITELQGRVIRWSPLGDQALTVWGESDRPYLLQLPQKCSGLATTRSVALSNASGVVTPGKDSVQLKGPSKAGSAYYCRIGSARLIDMTAVEKARDGGADDSPK